MHTRPVLWVGTILIKLGEWKIRNWRPGDEKSLVKYANNRNVSINLRDSFPYPYTLKHAEEWVRFALSQVPETNFAIASSSEVIGGIGLRLGEDVYRHTAEIGYWLGEPFWGKGIATGAVLAMTEHAFACFDLQRIEAHVYEWNPASARVLEKAGYIWEGRLRKCITKEGRTMDVFLYARVRE